MTNRLRLISSDFVGDFRKIPVKSCPRGVATFGLVLVSACFNWNFKWLRGPDLNRRPSGYENFPSQTQLLKVPWKI